MSTVFLHVGQCGNQVGHSFWKIVNQDKKVESSATFVDVGKMQRSVHVDSEPKVVNRLTSLPRSKVRKKNVIAGKRGRGSNWAMGYHGLKSKGDDALVENTLDAVRSEAERTQLQSGLFSVPTSGPQLVHQRLWCDSFAGTVVMHSLAGGTGSGLGSRLCESLRDEYPMNYLMSCAVVPCASGESPLQHYNSLLTLSHLQRYCDGVVLLYNDDVLKRLKKGTERSVSFDAINRHIAASLCGMFLPTDTLLAKNGYSTGLEPFEIVRVLCAMPAYKFIHVLHHSRKKSSLDGLVNETLKSLRRYNDQGKLFSCIGNVAVTRGGQVPRIEHNIKSKIKTAYNSVRWNPFPVDIWTASGNTSDSKDSASVTIAANYECSVEYLEKVLRKSQTMYNAGAYLHWYWRYGLTQEMFEESFEILQSTITEYKTAFS